MPHKQKHFWLACSDENSRPYLVYGGLTEEIARHKGLEILGGVDFQVRMFETRDADAASSMFRGKRLEDTHSLSAANQRVGRDRSLARMQRRVERRRQRA